MLYLKNEDTISCNVIVPKDIECMDKLKQLKRDHDYQDWSVSGYNLLKDVLYSSLDDINKQKVIVSGGINLGNICDIGTLEKIKVLLECNMAFEDKKYFIEHISSFKGFLRFVSDIYNRIYISEISRFNIKKLNELDTLSKEVGLWCESSNILESVDIAQNNVKVLNITKKISKFY